MNKDNVISFNNLTENCMPPDQITCAALLKFVPFHHNKQLSIQPTNSLEEN